MANSERHGLFAIFLAVLLMVAIVCLLFVTVDLAIEQGELKKATHELGWTYRQGILHQYSKIVIRSDKRQGDSEAERLVKDVRAQMEEGDTFFGKGDISRALPHYRSAGYAAERADNYLTCGHISCE